MSVLLTISLLIRSMLEQDYKQLQNLLGARAYLVPLVPVWERSHLFTLIKQPVALLGQ